MANGDINWIAGFIWNIADDVLRDVYVRGKYRDVILPMTVVRRLDAVLEPTKQAVLQMNEQLDKAGIANKPAALCQASGNAFYNVSPFPVRDLRARAAIPQVVLERGRKWRKCGRVWCGGCKQESRDGRGGENSGRKYEKSGVGADLSPHRGEND